METDLLKLAKRFLGVRELPGAKSNPFVLGMLRLDATWVEDDSTPWCSAFVNFIAWLLTMERSKSLAARSWLLVGRPVPLGEAAPGFDVVVLKRGSGKQPGPEVLSAPGHVGFFVGLSADGKSVQVLGGNQGDEVSIASFPTTQVLGVRRLHV